MTGTTSPKKEGLRILKDILNRDENVGATTVLVIGGMGSTKTSACLDLSEKIMERHADEKIFWRESVKSPVQFTKIHRFSYKVFIEEGYDIQFKNIALNKFVEFPHTIFKTFDDLFIFAEPQVLNVVFFKKNESWTDFILYLINQNGWQTVVFDEMEDVYPGGTAKKRWKWMQKSADVFKQCRKGYVSIIGNCHKGYNLDYRILDKIMVNLYGFGAKPPYHSRVKRGCLDRTKKGEFWIEEEYTRFGKIRVKTVRHPQGDPLTIFE